MYLYANNFKKKRKKENLPICLYPVEDDFNRLVINSKCEIKATYKSVVFNLTKSRRFCICLFVKRLRGSRNYSYIN